MPVSPMFRVQQVAEGVAGAPYYLNGYFDTLGGDAQNAADAWRTFLTVGVTGLRAGLRYEPITQVETVDPTTGQTTATTPVAVAGLNFTGAGDVLPPSNQLLVRWRTGVFVGGREVRGRTNLPGHLEASSGPSGEPVLSLVADQDARGQALIDDPDSRFVVYSPKNGSWEEVSSVSTWTKWAILRSRRD